MLAGRGAHFASYDLRCPAMAGDEDFPATEPRVPSEPPLDSGSPRPSGPQRAWQTFRGWPYLAQTLVWLVLGGVIVAATVSSTTGTEQASDVVYQCADGTTQHTPCPDTGTTSPPTTRERRTTTTAEPAPEFGSRRKPVPFGQTAVLSIGESDPAWSIRVLEFTPDATSAVLAENQFNDPPVAGRQFAMVRIEATYQGLEEPAMLTRDVRFVAVDESNLTYDLDDSCGVIPDALDEYGEVYAGGVLVGNLCWSVATEHIDSLVLGLSPAFGSGPPYFMALS
jgi:hypothetical protein